MDPATRSARHAPHGLTLVEMLVSMAVVAILMVGVLGAMTSNQKQFAAHAELGATQTSTRQAAAAIQQALNLTGFGIDPNFAVEPRNLTAAGAELAQRDGSGPFGSDELVVQYALPTFRREITGVNTGGFTLSADLTTGDQLTSGQRLQVMCPDASAWAYVTVDKYTPGSRQVALKTNAPAPFNQQDRLGASCFNTVGALVRKIERRHFFIAWFEDPRQGTPRPALMVNRGLDLNGNGTAGELPAPWSEVPLKATDSLGDSEVVALDIEQLQVAYLMNRPSTELATILSLTQGPDADGNFVFGDSSPLDTPSADAPVWSGSSTAPSPKGPPLFGDPACPALVDGDSHCGYGGKRRFTGHPGNIRGVRFTLVARSARPDPALPLTTLAEDGMPENLQQNSLPAATRHRRQRYQATVGLKNMNQRRPFVPSSINVDGA